MQELVELDRLIRKGKMRIQYKNRRILLVYLNEEVYAIDDKCPHMGSSLYPGKIEDDTIFCKDHGLGISLKSGEVASVKQADFMRLDEYSRSVKQYHVEVRDGKVYIE